MKDRSTEEIYLDLLQIFGNYEAFSKISNEDVRMILIEYFEIILDSQSKYHNNLEDFIKKKR